MAMTQQQSPCAVARHTDCPPRQPVCHGGDVVTQPMAHNNDMATHPTHHDNNVATQATCCNETHAGWQHGHTALWWQPATPLALGGGYMATQLTRQAATWPHTLHTVTMLQPHSPHLTTTCPV